MSATATAVRSDDVQERLRRIRRPRPVLDRTRERALTARQRELLDELQELFFAEGFADLTMASLARRLSCSLRTLYALAPSRDELVMVAVDRNLWRVGQAARAALDPGLPPLEALGRYLRAAAVAVAGWRAPFVRDLLAVPAAGALAGGHRRYIAGVTKALLDLAVERGDCAVADTGALAALLSNLAWFFVQPEVQPALDTTPEQAADETLELLLRGIGRGGAR